MCKHGTYKWVNIINPNQNNNRVLVDSCIAEEIQELNDMGIITLGCCCGHGRAGNLVKYENIHGKWQEQQSPPVVLIDRQSTKQAKRLGYKPFPFTYADGQNENVWQMYLKSGCVTEDDCKEWHSHNAIPYIENFGVINT